MNGEEASGSWARRAERAAFARPMVKDVPLAQGSSNLSLQVQSAAEFSSNPDQTHLPVIF